MVMGSFLAVWKRLSGGDEGNPLCDDLPPRAMTPRHGFTAVAFESDAIICRLERAGCCLYPGLRSVFIPRFVSQIEECCFESGVAMLEPGSLVHIGASAFSGCTLLGSLPLAAAPQLCEVPRCLCRDVLALRSVVMPDAVTVIESIEALSNQTPRVHAVSVAGTSSYCRYGFGDRLHGPILAPRP
jgi:hypothetical protein